MSVNGETGLWQDFKSGECGNFIHLISHTQKITYKDAEVYVRRQLFDDIGSLFDSSTVDTRPVLGDNKIETELQNFRPLNEESGWANPLLHRLALKFVKDRYLNPSSFLLATEGKFKDRLIIPYERDGIFYFQARLLSSFGVKYLNPGRASHGVEASKVLYPFDEFENYVLLCEGPLDAMSLQAAGINATCTQGSRLSHAQLDLVKDKKLIFAYDNDDAGQEGVEGAFTLCRTKNKSEFYVVRPPHHYKDWNDFWVAIKGDKKLMVSHVASQRRAYDFDFIVSERLA